MSYQECYVGNVTGAALSVKSKVRRRTRRNDDHK